MLLEARGNEKSIWLFFFLLFFYFPSNTASGCVSLVLVDLATGTFAKERETTGTFCEGKDQERQERRET